MNKNELLRRLPKIDEIMKEESLIVLSENKGALLVTEAVRSVISNMRQSILALDDEDMAQLNAAAEDGEAGKAALEKEIRECGDYCVLRPSVIYGPGNYAPRESIYFKWISAAGQILEPSPSDGFFQTVYVKDVARAALCACTDDSFARRAFNVTPSETITYRDYTEILRKACGTEFEVIYVTPQEAFMQQVPFPFAISRAESEEYDGSALEKTGFEYTDVVTGMKETWEYYVHSR